MAEVDCSYRLHQVYTVEGGFPPGGEQLPDESVLKTTQWFIDRLEDDNGSLKVNFLGLTP